MTEYVVFRATPGNHWQEVARLQANSSEQAIRAAFKQLGGGEEKIRLAATPTRSWSVLEGRREVQERLVFDDAPEVTPTAPAE